MRLVEEQLSEGREPDRIGYFSFTRKAANEAIFRAVNKFKIERKEFKWFRTLHSLAYQFLGCTHTDIIQDQDFEEFKENKNILVKIKKIDGYKCPRCWKIFKDKFENELCVRCEKVINENF